MLIAIPLSNVSLDGSVVDYGIDSLVGIEIRNWMRQELGCHLGIFEILGSTSIANLGDLAARRSRFLVEADFQDEPVKNMGKVDEQSEAEHDSGIGSEISNSPQRSRAASNASVELPSLPVPSLDDTLSAHLTSLRLILDNEEYQRSKNNVEDFISPGGMGQRLQARLMEYAKSSRNWHSDLWINDFFLGSRGPVVPFTSFFGVHEPSSISSASEGSRLYLLCSTSISRGSGEWYSGA